MEDIYTEINKREFYTAREVAINGFIKNNSGNGNDYNFVLKEIKRGVLKSINMNDSKKRPLFRVKSEDIITYLKSH